MACTRVVALAATLLASAGAIGWTQTAAERPRVVVAEFDGIIHPVSAEYLIDTIDQADTSGAEVVVFILRTPGGLLDSTRAIVSRMITSRAPVVVFVGPSGARAASAGFLLTIAADVAVMAPGTHIGAAHPVSGSGETMDETMSKKAASDTAAYVRSLAEARGRSVPLSADAVLESRAFTDREALEASPPLIDFHAADLDDLLRQLDGRTVKRFDGRSTTLDTTNADVVRVAMTRRQQFLSAIAHPQVAYLLMTLGMLGLTIELWNPGAVVPGVVGGLSLLLAFFALQILPVNTTGLLLILFGLGLLILELKIPSFGILGIGGTVSLLVGSIMMTRATPGIAVSLGIIVPVVLAVAAIVLFLGRLALKARAQPPATGVEGLIGAEGRVRDRLAADAPGHVDVHGEIWNARSRDPLPAGAQVRVVEVNGLTLVVEAAGSPPEGEHAWKV
ncbi:MAG: nodulation protein NfeD [Acidobacteria bacterium]|nr:nodulation protein NfeD [Acidobacteriota bacterium]